MNYDIFPKQDIVVRLRRAKKRGATCNEAASEIERLRKGIKDYIEGSAPARIAKTDKCPHGRYGYEECGSCIDDYFAKLLSHDEQSLPPENVK